MIRVGITMGDPSGIGPTILLKAIQELKGRAEFIIIGDRRVLERAADHGGRVTGNGSRVTGCEIVDLANVRSSDFKFGQIKARYGRASVEYLDTALQLIRAGRITCLVTCPVSKEAVHKAGYDFSGHTEYLARCTHTKFFVMMLMNKELKISLVTRHIPLEQVPSRVHARLLCDTIKVTHHAMQELFRIRQPRMVVTGLNPHASDNGLLGSEEREIIEPVIKRLRKTISGLDGPVSADVAMLKARQRKYDSVIAMYHDQALIALKVSDSETGVNMTLGLPFVRTSPLHGTAFDIAGTTSPNPASLIEAIKVAISCSQRHSK